MDDVVNTKMCFALCAYLMLMVFWNGSVKLSSRETVRNSSWIPGLALTLAFGDHVMLGLGTRMFATLVVLVIKMVKLKAPTYSGYHYPGWSVATGWVISVLIVSSLPVGMVYVLWKQKGSLSKCLRCSLRPVTPHSNHHNCEKGFRKDTELCPYSTDEKNEDGDLGTVN